MCGRIAIILTQSGIHHALIRGSLAPPTPILVRSIWQDFSLSLYRIHPPEAANANRDTGIKRVQSEEQTGERWCGALCKSVSGLLANSESACACSAAITRKERFYSCMCARAVNESGPMIRLTINLPFIRRVGGHYRKDSEGKNGPPIDGQFDSDHTSDNSRM